MKLIFLLPFILSFGNAAVKKDYKKRGFLLSSNRDLYFSEWKGDISDSTISFLLIDTTIKFTSVNDNIEELNLNKYWVQMKDIKGEFYSCGEEFRTENKLKYLFGEFIFTKKILSDSEMKQLTKQNQWCIYDHLRAQPFYVNITRTYDILTNIKPKKNLFHKFYAFGKSGQTIPIKRR
ncbi:MAG: hypothetical protein ABWZ79_07930 [Pedobacter agri]